jgi:ketosteroid isomerase-like protein
MSVEEMGELVATVFEMLSRGDTAEAGKHFATHARFDYTRSRGPNQGMYHGRAAIQKDWDDLLSMWDEWVVEPHDFVEAGEDEVLFSFRGQMKGRDGIELSVQAANIWKILAGQVVEATFFQSREDALEAARLTA